MHEHEEEHDEQSSQEAQAGVEQIILSDGRYRLEAFSFLHEGLAQAVKAIHGGEKAGPSSHVTGQQLCENLKNLARDRYGLLAPTVLRRWGVRGSIDFGQMVYLLIEHGLMRKTDDDSIEDFRDNFDLDRDFDITPDIRMKG